MQNRLQKYGCQNDCFLNFYLYLSNVNVGHFVLKNFKREKYEASITFVEKSYF
jgi:hypothetical protein